jgi:hypothetical protein
MAVPSYKTTKTKCLITKRKKEHRSSRIGGWNDKNERSAGSVEWTANKSGEE